MRRRVRLVAVARPLERGVLRLELPREGLFAALLALPLAGVRAVLVYRRVGFFAIDFVPGLRLLRSDMRIIIAQMVRH